MMPENEILPTSAVAELLGVTPEVIRKRKQRHSDQLIETQHWCKDSGTTYWTSQGVETLRQLLVLPDATEDVIQDETNLVPSDETCPITPDATVNVSLNETIGVTEDGTIAAFVDDLVETTAESIASEFWRKLPPAVIRHIKNPKPQVKETFKQQLRLQAPSFVPLLTAGMPGV